MVNYWTKRQYSEASREPNGLAKRGLVYVMSEFFSIPATSSVCFIMDTNACKVQFEFYDIGSDSGTVKAELLEGLTANINGSASVTPRNLNRNYSDAAVASLHAAVSWSGGTQIASELVSANLKAGAEISQHKIHTLRHDTRYGMVFYNVTNQPTLCHMNLGWSESDPVSYELILGGIDDGGVT
jgi:hypothetical protein